MACENTNGGKIVCGAGYKLILVTLLWSVMFAMIEAPLAGEGQVSYSPYIKQTYPTNVYWGDTHLHSRISNDGFISKKYGIDPAGRLSPDDSYAFARGETVTATNGMKVRLRKPLDFLVIADHAEAMGAM